MLLLARQLILAEQCDREHTTRLRVVGRVFRSAIERLVVVIDLQKNCSPACSKPVKMQRLIAHVMSRNVVLYEGILTMTIAERADYQGLRKLWLEKWAKGER
jgi:hypothetical protein